MNAFIIFGLRFKDDDDEFQRIVNAFIIFGSFRRSGLFVVNAFIIFGRFKDDDEEFQRRVNAFIIFGSFQRSGLFAVNPYEANNPKNDDYFRICSAMAVVVTFGVVGLVGVDDEQSGSPEMSSMACSSEIKEDGLRFILR